MFYVQILQTFSCKKGTRTRIDVRPDVSTAIWTGNQTTDANTLHDRVIVIYDTGCMECTTVQIEGGDVAGLVSAPDAVRSAKKIEFIPDIWDTKLDCLQSG